MDTPKGIRTPVASVKGRCPRPLDDGGEAVIASDFASDHQGKLRARLTLRQGAWLLLLFLSLPDRNGEVEAGSFVGFGDDPDSTAMNFNDPAADG